MNASEGAYLNKGKNTRGNSDACMRCVGLKHTSQKTVEDEIISQLGAGQISSTTKPVHSSPENPGHCQHTSRIGRSPLGETTSEECEQMALGRLCPWVLDSYCKAINMNKDQDE